MLGKDIASLSTGNSQLDYLRPTTTSTQVKQLSVLHGTYGSDGRALMTLPGKTTTAINRVLAVAPVSSYQWFNTSFHRIESIRRLGCEVKMLDSSVHPTFAFRLRYKLFQAGLPISLTDTESLCEQLSQEGCRGQWDALWLDKGMAISKSALLNFRDHNPNCVIVGFSPDDMFVRHNQSKQFLDHLPCYDVFFTTKSFNVAELKALGCERVEFIGNSYDENAFRPVEATESDVERLGGAVGFIGSYEKERAEAMARLAAEQIPVRVWGTGWEKMRKTPKMMTLENRLLLGDDFATACCTFKINLGFLRKINRDLQTTRSVEIPACGAFMLAERTTEHLELFEEGKEAEFFSSQQELFDKCVYFLNHENERQRIAAAGLQRCLKDEYSNDGRIRRMFSIVNSIREQKQSGGTER